MKKYLFVRLDEESYSTKESDNLDDFAEFNHYYGDPDSKDWKKEKKRIKAKLVTSWVYNGNDVHYAILTHPCWNNVRYIPYIITYADVENCTSIKEMPKGEFKFELESEHLDEVIDGIYKEDWFWAYIYAINPYASNDEEKFKYAYTIDDDGNVYNEDERMEHIKASFATEEEYDAFIQEMQSALDEMQ